MNELILKKEKESITSLELLEKINELRKIEAKEKENERAMLRHDTLLDIIRDEFEEEIGLQNLVETPYIHPQNKQEYPMFVLTLDQARQVLVRESKFVRRKVFEYIKFLESQNLLLRQALWNRQNSEWLQTRKHGKMIRRNETDVIASLILYAKEQGSKNADKMYLTYSKLVNSLVGIEAGMRDIVDFKTLINIQQLEDLFTKLIMEGMENRMYYKEIYKECKRIGTDMMKYLRLEIKLLRA